MRQPRYLFSLLIPLLLLGACVTPEASHQRSKYQMIDAGRAKALHDEGAVFVDMRDRHWFNQGHIPDAVNIPFQNFNDHRLARAVDPDQAVVFYCYGIQCEYSNSASARARGWGYRQVYYFMKGYPAWLDAGYPIAP